MLYGIKNFLEFLNANWTVIAVILGLTIAIIQRIKAFIGKTDDEKIRIAKRQIKDIMLKMVSEAELDFDDWNKAGAIKRSQVISQIYEMYPILSKVIDQNEFVKWLDIEINTSLQTLKDIININNDEG